MKISFKILTAIAVAAITYTGCVKKVDPIDDYGVSIAFNGGVKNLTGDVEVNPKDSIYLDFTLSSTKEDMAVVEIQKNGTRIDTFKVSSANARNFSAKKGYIIDSVPGDYTFRVFVRNSQNVYIGDGGKSIKVTVKPDLYYWVNRTLQVPDTVAKTNQNFFATASGNTFSFTSAGAANSAQIDFGYFYDTTTTGAPKSTIYALTASTFAPHDLTGWTKNATVFKKVTSPAFSLLTSGSAIRAAGIANLGSGTSSKITQLAGGNVILFKTAAGKYGVINVNYIDALSSVPRFINIDVRVER